MPKTKLTKKQIAKRRQEFSDWIRDTSKNHREYLAEVLESQIEQDSEMVALYKKDVKNGRNPLNPFSGVTENTPEEELAHAQYSRRSAKEILAKLKANPALFA